MINVKLLKKLVEIPTFSSDQNNCRLALALIKKEAERLKIPCIIGTNNGQPYLIAGIMEKATVLFLTHIDVVPASKDQFIFKELKARFWGRGVLDMKGPLIAALDSFISLWELGCKRIVFGVTSDEEIGGFKGTNFLAKTLFKNIKLAMIPDSTGEELVIIQKAPFHIRITASGKTCHGSKPWEGINAAENLLGCCKEIIEGHNQKNEDLTTVSLCQLHSGEATNQVPDKGEAILDIRIRSRSEVTTLINFIEKTTRNWGCLWSRIDEPLFFKINKNSIWVKEWGKAFHKIKGQKMKIKVESGASDARFLWSQLGIPVIITSANGGGAHSNSEWIESKSLESLSKILIEFVLSISKIISL